ncbi:LOG family protein [Myceligenerans indicum]|uniref:Rossmann fold nucleotide-binding protein n=1 Tax=Myceligenerans indicum TaxID=2593663 RepID=A0ABS1LG21_9MICO|nr:LOG family protein [Myceligenerans indicum]MBL0884793.1 Rossmann fold nucleotide-binding protein [Myceligenerans indicum]
MRPHHGQTIDVESLDDFRARVAAGARSMYGWHLQSLDLTGQSDAIRALDVAGALFLGCVLNRPDEESVRERGALVFPQVPGSPVDSYRPALYSARELYAGIENGYETTLDACAYAWSRQPRSRDLTLAQALHDHAIDDALAAERAGRRVVGIMGGHSLTRGSGPYGDAARLAHELARAGLTVATGGGPGAMEAANLGAYLAPHAAAELDKALAMLARVPSFTPSVRDWVGAALDVLDTWPVGADSFGIPTWHYGHEPPNPFATRIAKYFSNAIREAVLLEYADGGIVFLPGAAGTVQEVFQDACENYYADASSVAPMVLVGNDFWTRELPAWDLLGSLASERDMAARLYLVDTVDEVVPILAA